MTLRQAAIQMNNLVLADIKAGKKWTYSNTKSMGRTIEASRSNGYYRVNCNMGCIWAATKAGLFKTWPGNFYFKNGTLRGTAAAKNNVFKVFTDIGDINKTASQCVKEGILQPGDIVGYKNLTHTNMYIGDGMWLDTGHANCKGSGEGAVFTKFICKTPYGSYTVGHVLRPKIAQTSTGSETPIIIPDSTPSKKGKNITKTKTSEIQKMLNKVGNYNLLIDNDFGLKTTAAVMDFQKKNNLTVDGIVGQITLNKLKEKYQNNPAPTPATNPAPQTGLSYRVQTGSFAKKQNANNWAAYVKNKTNLDCYIEIENNEYKVFCGVFSVKSNADNRIKVLKANNIPCILREYKK